MLFSCSKESPAPLDEWVEIEPIILDEDDAKKLDGVFSGGHQLFGLDILRAEYLDDTLLYIINSKKEVQDYRFEQVSPGFPEIDFSKYSLVVGSYVFGSSGYKVVSEKFFVNEAKSKYILEVNTLAPTNTFFMVNSVGHWKAFPKLNSNYSLSLKRNYLVDEE